MAGFHLQLARLHNQRQKKPNLKADKLKSTTEKYDKMFKLKWEKQKQQIFMQNENLVLKLELDVVAWLV